MSFDSNVIMQQAVRIQELRDQVKQLHEKNIILNDELYLFNRLKKELDTNEMVKDQWDTICVMLRLGENN